MTFDACGGLVTVGQGVAVGGKGVGGIGVFDGIGVAVGSGVSVGRAVVVAKSASLPLRVSCAALKVGFAGEGGLEITGEAFPGRGLAAHCREVVGQIFGGSDEKVGGAASRVADDILRRRRGHVDHPG